MKKLLLAATVSAIVSPALAADPVVYVDAAPVAERFAHDWTGFYVGVHAGYGWGDNDVVTTLRDGDGIALAATATNSFDADGAIGGFQAGYNFQVDQFVFGVEGEYSFSDVNGSFNFDETRPEAIAGGSLEWIAAIKGRAGITFDRTLVYATGGYAVAKNEGFANNVFDAAPAIDVATGSETMDGYVVGLGIEHALTQNLSIRGEYNYYDFGSANFNMVSDAYPEGVVLETQPDITLNVVKVGLNYRF